MYSPIVNFAFSRINETVLKIRNLILFAKLNMSHPVSDTPIRKEKLLSDIGRFFSYEIIILKRAERGQ